MKAKPKRQVSKDAKTIHRVTMEVDEFMNLQPGMRLVNSSFCHKTGVWVLWIQTPTGSNPTFHGGEFVGGA